MESCFLGRILELQEKATKIRGTLRLVSTFSSLIDRRMNKQGWPLSKVNSGWKSQAIWLRSPKQRQKRAPQNMQSSQSNRTQRYLFSCFRDLIDGWDIVCFVEREDPPLPPGQDPSYRRKGNRLLVECGLDLSLEQAIESFLILKKWLVLVRLLLAQLFSRTAIFAVFVIKLPLLHQNTFFVPYACMLNILLKIFQFPGKFLKFLNFEIYHKICNMHVPDGCIINFFHLLLHNLLM